MDELPSKILWGKQTRLSLQYFAIGTHKFSADFIYALVAIKRACAQVNGELKRLSTTQSQAIIQACDQVLSGQYNEQFPLRVWQTGSGTQTNMNVNEVLASVANQIIHQAGAENRNGDKQDLHPNDHINLSQSSNDVFPTAMRIVVAQWSEQKLLPAIATLQQQLQLKRGQFSHQYTVARTHLMDAIPIGSGALLAAFDSQLEAAKNAVHSSLQYVHRLAIGGTAVGSGANAPQRFGEMVSHKLAERLQLPLQQDDNLYAAVSGEDAMIRYSGALKQLASVLLKMANDFRLLGSGPRCGLNEWQLPANEPGSSIMPGKVNPTQCEALSMVCFQVFGNELTVSLAAANGQLQLNACRPVIIHNVMESITLLTDAMSSFAENAVAGLSVNTKQMQRNMQQNLSVITLLAEQLGYDTATQIVRKAQQDNTSLAVAAKVLGLYSEAEFEQLIAEKLNRLGD
ncbi:class II fumarate hydratase [Thalassotalea mangrovi]|uniref:fumarate hydratase n=1 Tax=Thalassotalea mangrovi TaxID=2572245 RepID=A0A4U1B3T9_9GAMM|nr:class II fumarate hydratase [Thalassotalea mangrovi]TKB44706.1 class II fumarate hydratase [Thalassotalea mangrovi]